MVNQCTTISDWRLQILDFREGTQIIMMIMISSDHNHQSDLRSPFAFSPVNHCSLFRNRTLKVVSVP
jgi:hypothetical protein